VAVIGISERPGNLGMVVWRNLRSAGFKGPVWLVDRRNGTVEGERTWPDIESLPETPDLAVVCTPAASVPELIAALGRKGTRAATVLSAGLKQGRASDGSTLEKAMLDAARPHLLRILGPNCVGMLAPHVGLNASFSHAPAREGHLAFVSQSGALTTALLDWARSREIGFSHFVSLGEAADVDFGDTLNYLAGDQHTRAILLYIESIKSARKFMSAARAASRSKPIIVVKAGRAPEGAKAAASHTGALAGADDVYDAALKRAGAVRVDSMLDLFVAA
jgi:acetyltransferase